MTTDPLAQWWNTPVIVERRTGTGSSGDVYSAATTEVGFVDDTTKLVRATDGQQVVSSSRVYLPATTPVIPIGSRVTLPANYGTAQRSTVLTSSVNQSGLPTPDHVELALQ